MKRCPNNRIHIGNECHCVPGNSFVYRNGRWYTQPESAQKQAQHNMLSLSGQMTTSDLIMPIVKIGLWCILFTSILAGVMYWQIGKMGNDLKKAEQTKITREVKVNE